MVTPIDERTDASRPGSVSGDLLRAIAASLAADDHATLVGLVDGFQTADIATIIELLDGPIRVPFILALGDRLDVDVFSELDETVRDSVRSALPKAYLARAIGELDTDDATYVLDGLEEPERRAVLDQLSARDRSALLRNLEYPEETAGHIMQADVVAVPPFWTVDQVIDFLRGNDDLPDRFSELFVVDPTFRVLGAVSLSKLLRVPAGTSVAEIMDSSIKPVLATEDQEDVARRFKRYDLMSAPVVDESARLVGVITVDDVVEVIQDEADEDIRLLGGVGDESLLDTVLDAARSRFTWLLLNMFTAILASSVISLFDASIEQMVALAVLMPIVASMGGNAGTQTMTVAVRALGTKDLSAVNASRVILRESSIGLVNGLVFATLLGTVTFIWFGSGALGLVIGSAMIFNLCVAALAGIVIPLVLDRVGFDPAIASGVFLTTITDVVGFFVFLGLATIWLL
ncbi:MAG: magnesium transporter [Hyphomicrobiaceae bacterium]